MMVKKIFFTFLAFLLVSLSGLAQAGMARIYIGLFNNLENTNLHSTLLEICSKYTTYSIFISNDQFPLIISNETDLDYFFKNQAPLLNPTYPDIYFELDTLLKLDVLKDFLSFNRPNQPSFKERMDFYFFVPNESASKIIKELVIKYFYINGLGDIDNFNELTSVTIYSKDVLLDADSIFFNDSFDIDFKTY